MTHMRPKPNLQTPDQDQVLMMFQRHQRWLRTVVRARLGQQLGVDDVMQEISLALVASSQRPTDPDKWAPWLYRVAVHQVLMHRRRLGRQRGLSQRYADRQSNERTPADEDPLQWVMSQEACSLVRQSLDRLSDQDREILLLKHTEHWTYRQIAQHLGLPVHKVEYRLTRARGRLRQKLVSLQVNEVLS